MPLDVIAFSGIQVRIDRPVGFVQRGTGPNGPWSRTYTVPYGEILGTEGGDGDCLDVFCGPNPDATTAYWASQVRRDGVFDEFKFGLGFYTREAFIACYCAHIPAELLGRVWSQPIAQVQALLGLDPRKRAAAMRDVLATSAETSITMATSRPFQRTVEDRARAIYEAHRNQTGWKTIDGTYHARWNGKAKLGNPETTLSNEEREKYRSLARRLDLGQGDVHVETGATKVRPTKTPPPAVNAAFEKTMAEITPAARKALPAKAFALPATRQYPIHDAAHVRNAAARLEQNKRTLKPAQYREAKAAIAAAAKRFGVTFSKSVQEAATSQPAPMQAIRRKGLHMRVGFGPGGEHHVEIMHANTNGGAAAERAVAMADRTVRPDAIEIDVASIIADEQKAADLEAQAAAIDPTVDAAMADREALLSQARKLRDDAAAPRWNQIAKVGIFRGHPAGPFELNPKVFEEVVRNYTAVDLGQVALDFEHASEEEASAGSIPQTGAPAQGWVLALENRGEAGLWGLIEHLPLARGYVLGKQYRFFSPAIRFGARHPETGQPIGARLTSVAYTNKPFLRGLAPLAAKDAAPSTGATTMSTSTSDPHEMMKSMKACMGLHPLATGATMKACLADMREHAKPILDKDKTHAAGFMAAGANLSDYIHPLADVINAPANMTIAEILDAVEGMIDSAMEQHVEEYHMSDIDPTQPTAEAETTTTLTDAADLAVKLGAANEKNRVLMSEKVTMARAAETEKIALMADKTALLADKAGLELRLKDAEGTVATLTAEKATLDGEIAKMRDAEVKRADDAIVAAVDSAYATYKDVKKLTDEDKQAMLITARAKPDLFAKLYPPVAGAHQHLLTDLTGSGGRTQTTTPGPQQPAMAPVLTPAQMSRLSSALVTTHKMTAEKASSLAYSVAMGHQGAAEKLPQGLNLATFTT